jgi:hypothetical protein
MGAQRRRNRAPDTIPYKGKDPRCQVAIRNPFAALGQRPNALCDCVDAIHLDLMHSLYDVSTHSRFEYCHSIAEHERGLVSHPKAAIRPRVAHR